MTVAATQVGLGPAGVAGRAMPDVESSTEAYARRFAGPAGAYMLGVQTRAVLRLLGPWRGGRVLDVGGGHAQIAGPLTECGWDVTVLGSADRCHDRVRRMLGGRVRCATGDLTDPPFEDGAFDAVVCLRMLAHTPDWRRLVGGLCRVARTAVIVDFPTPLSINAATPLLFGLKRRLEPSTRRYALIGARAARRSFAAHGFGRTARCAQFFWPMALHRALGRPRISRALEAGPGCMGVTALAGSPVVMLAVRDGVEARQ